MSDAINAALAAAAQSAAETPAASATNLAPAVAAAPSLPAMGAGGAPRSLADFMDNASMNVEAYLGVSELGLRFGKDKQLHEHVDVEMVFKNAKFGYVIRVNTPTGVQYLTSWDGQTEAKSRQNWGLIVQQAQAQDKGSYPSDLIEFPVTLIDDYARKEGGPLVEGKVIGLSISYQNAKVFGAFLKEQFPKVGMDKPFRVRIGYTPKRSGGGQEYGVFDFQLLDEAAPALANDAPTKGKTKAA